MFGNRVALGCCLMLFAAGFARAQEGPPAGKIQADIAPEKLQKAEALIRDLYAPEFARAVKDEAAQRSLALLLLQEARDTRDYPAGRLRLFQFAMELAATAGDAGTTLQAIDEMGLAFGVPPAQTFPMKVQALVLAGKGAQDRPALQGIVEGAQALVEEAIFEDDFAAARRLLEVADQAGRRLRSVPLVSSLRRRQEEVQRLERAFARWKPYADELAQNPKDPRANREMGVYQAFFKGNWEKGLPLLERSDNPTLAKLAAADRREPGKIDEQIALGDGWFDVAAGFKDAMADHLLLRAYHWYQAALPNLKGAQQQEVEKRMERIMKILPAELRIGAIAAETRKLEGHLGPVYAAAFSPDGRLALSAGAGGLLRLWDVRTGKELRRLEGHSGRVWALAFSPDGKRAASGGFDDSIRIWDLVTRREILRLPGHDDYVRSVAFSADGQRLLSGGDDRLVRLWDLQTGKEIRKFPGHDHYVWSVALSRDGKKALSGSLDKTVRLWDVETGKEQLKLTGHVDTVLAVDFSPEGSRALSGSTDRTMKLWDLTTGKEIRTFTGNKGYVLDVAFSPDGRRALSASQDGTLRLWDVATGEELRTLEGHQGQVWSIAFSREGRRALSAGQDRTVRIWGPAR